MNVICEYSVSLEYGFRAYCMSVALRGARVVILDVRLSMVLHLWYFPSFIIPLFLGHSFR